MQIISKTIDFEIPCDTVVSIGKFDGIHKGHGEILKIMQQYKQRGLKTLILTFDIPPQSVFAGKDNKVLTTVLEKRTLFEELGIDYLVEFPFNEKTASIDAEKFIEEFLIGKMRMKAVVVGSDCRFGYKGRGNKELLKNLSGELEYEVSIIDKIFYNDREISSTLIREYIEQGNIGEADKLLLYPYFFYGEVVHGRKLGRTIGMPTINLVPEGNKLLPPAGVYFSRVRHMGMDYRAITNIGYKPTVSDVNERVMGVETYIYNFGDEIYGDKLYVSLYEFLRGEQKFASVDELKSQLDKDIIEGEKWHKANL